MRGAAWAILVLVLAAGCASPPEVPIGQAAPDLTLQDIDGNEITLQAWRGQPVLLEVFGVHCGSCRAMMNQLLPYSDAFGRDGRVHMLSIDPGRDFDGLGAKDVEEVRAWRAEFNANWTFAHEPTGDAIGKYPAPARPTIYLIDREGRVSVVHGGWTPFEKLRAETENLLRS